MNNKNKTFSYIFGQIIAAVIMACGTSIVIIGTIKLLQWLLSL